VEDNGDSKEYETTRGKYQNFDKMNTDAVAVKMLRLVM
jgi:hypothetical protein